MKNKARLFGAYLPIFLIASLSAVVLRTVACFISFDYETGYFKDSILIGIADGIVIFASVFFLTYIFSSRKDINLIPTFTSPQTYVPVGLISTALLFMSVHLGTEGVRVYKEMGGFSDLTLDARSLPVILSRLLALMPFLLALLAILSLVNLLFTALDERHISEQRGGFGLFTVAFFALYVVYLYFDNTTPINAPTKIVSQMAMLFASVFFLYETRISLGREKWRQYVAFGFIASMLSAYSSIPSLLVYLAKTDVAGGSVLIAKSVYEIALTLALFIFITARILLLGELIEDKESTLVTNIVAEADKRALSLANKEKADPMEEEAESVRGESDDNQISIEDIPESDSEHLDNETDTEIN